MNWRWGAVILPLLCAVQGETRGEIPRKYLEGLPFPMVNVREAHFPSRSVNITSYGAAGDGATLNTSAIENAIRACSAAGGGTVEIPPGVWLTGPVRLASNIRLNIEKGGLLLFSSRFEDYPLLAGPDGTSKTYRCMPCLYGYRLENVAITGGGMLDGQGQFWRPVKKEKMTPGPGGALRNPAGPSPPTEGPGSRHGKQWRESPHYGPSRAGTG